jgi:membrane protein YqaA with SNARE-associated domain
MEVSAVSAPGRGWLRRVAALAHHRHSTPLLAAIAFADSSFLPVPPDLLLIPMSLLRPERMRFLMLLCVAASSLGAALGYFIGYGLWDTVGAPLVQLYGCTDKFAAYQQLVAHWGFTIIIVKAFTPIPFKIAAIAAGVAAMDPISFMLATVIGRALHFAILAALLLLFGSRVTEFVVRYERPVAVVSIAVLLGAALGCYFR